MMKEVEKKTRIVCTIGPASEDEETLRKMVKAGMNVMRLNFSHGDYEEHGKRIETLRRVCEELHRPVAILLDTKGPEFVHMILKAVRLNSKKDRLYVLHPRRS